MIGLTQSAALEYASRGIRINAVCPGTIETPMVADMLAKEPDAMKDILRDQPIGRLGRPEEIAVIDSKTTEDFISLLPLTLTMDDLFRREKFGHLPRAISKEGKQTRTYEVGDIAYWAQTWPSTIATTARRSPTPASSSSARSIPAWKLMLPTVVARGKAGFPAEALREMAGTGVANLKGNGHNTLLRFAEQSSRSIHPQIGDTPMALLNKR